MHGKIMYGGKAKTVKHLNASTPLSKMCKEIILQVLANLSLSKVAYQAFGHGELMKAIAWFMPLMMPTSPFFPAVSTIRYCPQFLILGFLKTRNYIVKVIEARKQFVNLYSFKRLKVLLFVYWHSARNMHGSTAQFSIRPKQSSLPSAI